MSHTFMYLKYYMCTNIIHMNITQNSYDFLYKPMKTIFHTKICTNI